MDEKQRLIDELRKMLFASNLGDRKTLREVANFLESRDCYFYCPVCERHSIEEHEDCKPLYKDG